MNPDYQKFLLEVVSAMLKPMDIDPAFSVEKENEQFRITIISKTNPIPTEPNFIFSLQHITRVIVHHTFPEEKGHFLLDISGAKKMREQQIYDRVPILVQDIVLKDGITVILTGLSGYERKLVHGILSDIKGLETTSVGAPDNRKLLVIPNSQIGTSGIENAKIVDLFSK